MEPDEQFRADVEANIRRLGSDTDLPRRAMDWMVAVSSGNYLYNFSWLGRPIIQYPQDIVAVQELIWRVRPDLVIETGIAHGGSLVLSASMLALLDYCDAVAAGTPLDPRQSRRRVLGVDIDIRAHNRAAIAAHPMAHLIEMVQGSSIDASTVATVTERARAIPRVMVMLDSNHTHDHVLAELRAYAPLVSKDSYCVVFDTLIENTPPEYMANRPWGPGNSPRSAVHAYLDELKADVRGADGELLRLEIDRRIQDQLQITVAPDGFLHRV